MVALYILLVLMIIGAIVAIELKDLLSSVVAVGAVGLGLALVSLLLKAPDVAITQLVVELVTLVILIRATLRRDVADGAGASQPAAAVVGLAFLLVLVVAGTQTLDALPAFGEPYMRVSQRYVEAGLEQTGAANLVSAVLLDYRAWDTLGEATVLFAAAMGVLAVARKVGRAPSADRETPHG
jgi:multisubunit Na+/H+ antiporter MnhB subunit